MAGKPWIGFAVRKAPGKSTLLVQDVAEDGPADKAGLRHGDEISTIEGRKVTTSQEFKAMFKHWEIGQYLTVEIFRDAGGVDNAIQKTCHLRVGEKTREVIKDPPPLKTTRDVEAILKDSDKLEKCSAVIFGVCDEDLSGLVTREEFSTVLSRWFTDQLGMQVDRDEMEEVFDSYDRDKSGFIKKSEFTPVTKACLEAILRKHKPSSGGTDSYHPGTNTPAATPGGGTGTNNNVPANNAPSKKKKKSWKEKCCPCCKKKNKK